MFLSKAKFLESRERERERERERGNKSLHNVEDTIYTIQPNIIRTIK
jgi:hypothetical protein